MADARLAQSRVRSLFAESTGDARASQMRVRTIIGYPADAAELSQSRTRALWAGSGGIDARLSQARVRVIYKGYVERPHVRVWTYNLDGHDHYVARLGPNVTLELDLATGQWAEWSGHGLPYWRAHRGINWLGMGKTTADRGYGTNIVAGDDRVGILWMLDPTAGVDDAALVGNEPVPYTRTVTGIVPQVMRQTAPDGAIYLTISLGQPVVTAAGITLRVSDDWGVSFRDAGTITVEPGNFTQEVAWRSLGLVRAPGRIYEFSDTGAAARIAHAERR